MTENPLPRGLSRRTFLAGGAGVLGAAAVGTRLTSAHAATPMVAAVPKPTDPSSVNVHLVGTDGWVAMPGAPDDAPFFPDTLAPSPFNTYVFGFRNVSGFSPSQIAAERGKAQISAPMMYFDEEDDIFITLTNLGLSQRPDLYDGHTLHWHGFVNAIPLFDGVPELSLAVPIGRDFTYFYKPHDAGTYMYHCHFEDVEHVQMGMTGMVFVRPRQNQTKHGVDPAFAAGRPTPWGGTVASTIPPGKYAYNDYDGSTRYDREFAFMVTELWSAAHYRDAHIQVNDWTDYDPSFWLLNGRAYPDTVAPNSGTAGANVFPSGALPVLGADPAATANRLQYQPISSLISCEVNNKVLLRLSNLGYQNHAFTVDNIDLSVIAKDGSLLKGRDGTVNYLTTNTVDLGPGESRDVIFTAPSQPGRYLLYDRHYSYLNNGGGAGYGGMVTEIRVGAAGSLGAQSQPNH
ncbi:multicopper oxidase domain-containing protein [Jatrophihabitans telluris]|uniref:Multicopper oxidase domain-containing protein n=1 Tax=Jatrophihabitans telluris TaxID=2038343 RepID=A0ABY4QX23_9ACTN|nr:multicopper oxidase domain-containing protein [Jatrophihabitans telluris]UQX87376.1 multicopper oxidase domain-containing protein [Jatrophihabitans telluris]